MREMIKNIGWEFMNKPVMSLDEMRLIKKFLDKSGIGEYLERWC